MAEENVGSDETLDLAEQLRCPNENAGSDFGQRMYDSNKGMIIDSIAMLRVRDRNRVLEIGPGNASHLESLLQQALKLRYFGLEISRTMIDEAQELNANFISERKALFRLYDGLEIPYVRHFFDRIITVNTIYFWKEPKVFLAEMYRVLKPGGTCVITFVEAEFMKKLSFVNESFNLYTTEELSELMGGHSFELSYFQKKKKRVRSKSGEIVDRDFTIAILKKNPKIKEPII